jgi:hypothetical protein
LIKEVEKDANIFYSIVKIIKDGSYKELFDKEDIKKIDYYLKKLNNIELAASLFISEKNGEFNLYGIKLNQNKLVEICKKYLDSSDLKELTAQELNIIKLIKNYYLKKIDEYNIFDVYEISKEKDIGLNKIFEIIKRIELDTSKIDYIFPFIITLVEVDGFYKLIYKRKYFNPQNIDKEISTIEFIIEKNPEIFKYWLKVLGKEKIKNIVLYYNINQGTMKFLFSEVFNKEEIRNMLYELIRNNKEEIIKFVLSKYQELAYITDEHGRTLLHHAVINNSLSLVEFLISVYISYKEKLYIINLKDNFGYTVLDYAIEKNYNEIVQILTRYGASSSDIFISVNTINSSLGSNREQWETINSSLGSNREQWETINSSLGSNREQWKTINSSLGSNWKHREAVVAASIFGILTFLLGLFGLLPYADNPVSGLLEVILFSFVVFGFVYILVLVSLYIWC